MGKYSAKTKIIMLGIAWAIISATMFLYLFNLLDASNDSLVQGMAKQKQDLAVLQGQKQSYELAQADLQKLSQSPLQPEDFFDKDTTFVNEIQWLEDVAQKLSITMHLSGISGTVSTEPKVLNASTPLVMVPYSINLSGSLSQIVGFLEVLEHASFITNVSTLSVQSSGKGLINASLSADFYLKN